MEEKADAAQAATLNGAMTDVNFLYGRPSYGDQQRTLAYYYEDDDDYDMKNMHVNDAYDYGESDVDLETGVV